MRQVDTQPGSFVCELGPSFSVCTTLSAFGDDKEIKESLPNVTKVGFFGNTHKKLVIVFNN